MEAGAIEMGKGRRKPEALRCRGGNETVEFRDAIGIEHIQGTSQRVIMEMLGLDPGGDEALRRFILKKHRDEVELLVHKAEPMEDHRFDGAAHGDDAGLRCVLHGPVQYVTNAKFVKHPGHETEMVQDLTPYGRCIGVSSREEIVPTHGNYSNRLEGVRKVGFISQRRAGQQGQRRACFRQRGVQPNGTRKLRLGGRHPLPRRVSASLPW